MNRYAFLPVLLLTLSRIACGIEPCEIRIVEQGNGWPVPLVELTTTHHVRFVSDNAGKIAFDLPELMNVETWFNVRGHGYSVAKDAFGFSGVRLTPRPGETLTIKVRRQLAAQRLGRMTGQGLLAESQKLGQETAWIDQGIVGCDSVQNALYDGKLHWGWGDTSVPGYPLGRFHMTGATTARMPLGSLEPPLRLRFDYVTDGKGAPRDVAKMPGTGPTWLFGYVTLPDKEGREKLCATYSKIKPPLEEYEKGLCVWNRESERFERLKVLWETSPAAPQPPVTPHGHAVLWKDKSHQSWVLFGDPFPTLKCPATYEAWSSPATWQPLSAQTTVPIRNSGDSVKPHRGAISWNDFRKKWVTVFTQHGGDSSFLGEIWYAESDTPTGPWKDAIKVVTHDQYTFYNPQLHSGFVPAGSPILLFEGTYTATFSKASVATPRHDYNQILYRLDLDEWPWDSNGQ